MKKSKLYKGIAIMLFSSTLTCLGQLCWKMSSLSNWLLFTIIGFAFYGLGALLMIIALRFGKLSVLHPMLGFGYVISVILGQIALKESITVTKVLGIIIVIIGISFIAISDNEETRQ